MDDADEVHFCRTKPEEGGRGMREKEGEEERVVYRGGAVWVLLLLRE